MHSKSKLLLGVKNVHLKVLAQVQIYNLLLLLIRGGVVCNRCREQ